MIKNKCNILFRWSAYLCTSVTIQIFQVYKNIIYKLMYLPFFSLSLEKGAAVTNSAVNRIAFIKSQTSLMEYFHVSPPKRNFLSLSAEATPSS